MQTNYIVRTRTKRETVELGLRYCKEKTLLMTSAQVVETPVSVTTNSPSQVYTHPDNRTYRLMRKVHTIVAFESKIKKYNQTQLWLYLFSTNIKYHHIERTGAIS